jgi:hypothetical protein
MSRPYTSPVTGEICDQETYLKEWDNIRWKLKNGWNLDVTTYDPYVSVLDGNLKGDPRYNYSSVQLPLWLVLRMISRF